MNFKTHKIQPVFPILKITFALGIFYLIAILISPAKIYTAIFYLRIFIPLVVIASIYMIMTAKNAQIVLEKSGITLNLDFGRNKSTTIDYSVIDSLQICQNPIEKLFNVYTVKIIILSKEPQIQKTASFINQYMIFNKESAKNIKQNIEHLKRPEV